MQKVAGLGALAALLFVLPARAAWAGGALDEVARGAAQSLGATPAAPRGSVVVAAPLVSDVPAPRADELALRVAALVAGRLEVAAGAQAQTAQLGTARALAGRAGALVYVQTEIARGDLRATIDVYPSMANAWDRIRNPVPAPARHAFATTKIDAEVRTYLLPLLLEQAAVDRAHHDEGDVLAAACGDVDADGGNEVVLVSTARVALGRVRGDRFVPDRAVPWDAIAPLLPVPTRDPLAAATIADGAAYVGSTDRGGMRLKPDLTLDAPLLGLPVQAAGAVACLLPEPSAGAFDGAPVDCPVGHDARPKIAVPAPRFDAFASAVVGDASGAARAVVVVREPSGRLRLKSGDLTIAPEGTFGAQLAVGDLDQDGVPDVITTADATSAAPGAGGAGRDDAIDVANWLPGDPELRARVHVPAPGGVRALAVCPPEGRGAPALVAVVGSEVWVIRATPKASP
jgi:hypothetical protein